MIVTFGKSLFGKVDAVAGKCHVAVACWHFCYLPIVPVATWVVTSEKRTGLRSSWTGVQTSFSIKAYLMGLLRAVLWLTMLISFCLGLSEGLSHSTDRNAPSLMPYATVTIISAILLFAPYWIPGIGRATPARAAQLLSQLGARSRPTSR